ncbi:D-2-hydroxyacid dehydrogenase [Longimicrobium sp.]|uniref:D-2-hydroxyacid dehydrogenase n=1 Tax=Longimicrobium sp. TaxID=2029185 RepID=UPI002B59E75E|nr:D-2-hydroxyacid dehydrogenase [Longimicrobium sp.]HSU12638.1 D-2-hydroxyacid dehydrogenase [Longimicrobium sp.]
MPERRRLVVNLRDQRPVWAIPPACVDEIRAALPEGWECVVVDAYADGTGDGRGAGGEALEAARGAEIYLGWGVPREIFLAAGDALRWAHSASAGVGGVLYAEMRESDVILTNSAGTHAEPIAETVLAMMLHFARGIDFAVRAQAERRWDKSPFDAADTPVRELADATVGLLGLGGIGRAVGRRASALGMRVVATRRSSAEGPPGVEVMTGEGALERMLAVSDYFVVTVPRTADTEGMIGARELSHLPRNAVLINVSRGDVVDEAALVEALRSGGLRGAGLDVFATEPLPAASPLWTLPNALLLPHVSGTSLRFWRRETDLIVANLRRYLSGEPLLNTVDKQAGY